MLISPNMVTQMKESVAVVIRNASGDILIVRRDENDDSLPGVWGFPAASLRPGETPEDAVIRAGESKLGVKLAVLDYLGDDAVETGSAVNRLSEYAAEIAEGTPSVPQRDTSVSQYVDVRFTDDPTALFEAAREGSMCSRIYLRQIGIEWA